MFLKFNRIIFGALIFSLIIPLIACMSFGTLAAIGALFAPGSWGAIAIALLYVLIYCFISSYVAFLISGFVKEFGKALPKWEGYLFTGLAALPINVYLLFASWKLEIFVFIASVITVYFGEKVYWRIWDKIEAMQSGIEV